MIRLIKKETFAIRLKSFGLFIVGLWAAAVGARASHFEDPWLLDEAQRLLSPGSTFLLFPRPAGEPLLPSLAAKESTPVLGEDIPHEPWENFLSRYRPLKIRSLLYHETRDELDFQGRKISEYEAAESKIAQRFSLPESLQSSEPEYKPKPPELEIPSWEGKVSIAGRKLIALNLQMKKYLNPESPLRPRTAAKPSLDLRQELQLRISGNVSDRVTVNVDYDDTKENKRDISIVYRGAPGEAVKEISFGDISLNLPQTQFTSYSKQLFGIKGEFDFKRARMTVVGSQTKGQFAIKRFSGQHQFESGDIKDTSYIRRTYYDVAFDTAHLPLQSGSVVIYRDDRNANNDSNAQELTIDDYAVAASTYTGKFDTLVAGTDFVVDHQRGILKFTNSQAANAIVAIDYTAANGSRLSGLNGTGRPKAVKTDNESPLATGSTSEIGYRKELKTFYTFGKTKIQRDDGKGSFILKLLDSNRTEYGSKLGIQYPDQILVDFEQGTFQLTQPIPLATATAVTDSEIYQSNAVSKYVFAYEIRFVLKTYILQPNMVLQSEKVYKNGQLLTRDIDYFIDYDSGFLTFLRPESITPDTQLEVTYEVAPFGSRLTETLLGARGEVDLLNNINGLGFSFSKLSLGSSILLQQAAKPATIPDARNLPSSYSIFEGDMRLSDIKLPLLPIQANFHGELAASDRDPNTFGKALIESMEGIKIEDSAILQTSFWLPASNPGNQRAAYAALTIAADTEKIKTINPSADVGESETQEILKFTYDLNQSTSVSASYVFSPIGLDFSAREFLELSLLGDTTSTDAPEISFSLGRIDEDADGDGALDTEDANQDGGLNFGEDAGWTYNNPDGSTEKVGLANGRIDTEDLDKNGRLDTEDPSIGGTFGLTTGSTSSATNFTNWLTTTVSLGITGSNQSRWVSVKALRLTIRRTTQSKTSGIIRIAKIAVTGSKWERPTIAASSGTMRAGPINNVDNTGYTPLFSAGGDVETTYNELYGGGEQSSALTRLSSSRREQALRLIFQDLQATGSAPGTASTRLPFTKAINLQTHQSLSFFLRGPSVTLPAGSSFYLQLGSANDYYEYQVPLDNVNLGTGWHLLKIAMNDVNRDGNVDQLAAANKSELNPQLTVKGNPSLTNVTQIVVGIAVPAGAAPQSNEVWVNDIFLDESREKSGIAKYAAGDFSWPGWMSGGASFKSYNRDFESPGQAVVNQDLIARSGNLSFTRLSFMPIQASAARQVVITPSAIQTGSNLVSQLSEGRVETESLGASGSVDLPLLPPVSWSTNKNTTDNTTTKRLDETQSHSGSLSWPAPLGIKFIQGWNNSAARGVTRVQFADDLRKSGSDNLEEISDTLSTSMNLGFFGNRITLAPTYRLSEVKETREKLNSSDILTIEEYPKSASQNTSLSTTLRLTSWLEPSASFSSSIQESHRVESATFTLSGVEGYFHRGDLKSVNRQSQLSVSQNLDFARILPSWRLFRSFSHYASYQISDGDSYENVNKDFNSSDKLWVRQELEINSPGARRTNLTTRDSISVNSRWSPFAALWSGSTLSSLSLTNNYSNSLDRTETTGTTRKSQSINFPDLTGTLTQIERLLRTQRWMSSTSLSTRYSVRQQSTIDVDRKIDTSLGSDFHFIAWQKYDLTVSYSQSQNDTFNLATLLRTGHTVGRSGTLQLGFNWRIWRLSNKVSYSDSLAVDSSDKVTADQKSLAPSISVRGDFSLPAGLRLPFSQKRLTFTNRAIVTSSMSLDRKSSSLNVDQTNTETWNWNLSGDFEIGKNLRAGMGSAFSLFRNRVLNDQDFYTFGINGQVVFQF
ncbi:MAG: hypothetical protein HY547_01775 [Elusimicrobia bacterium]|nr:hypothetical protein [Elusimicrobiota bacterium]